MYKTDLMEMTRRLSLYI